MVAVGVFDELFDGETDFDTRAELRALETVVEEITAANQQFVLQTADARSRDKLVRVWVNAQGVPVQVQIDEELFAESTNTQVAASMLEAAQAAAAIMQRRTETFSAELQRKVALEPMFAQDSIAHLDVFEELQQKVPLSPPDSPERHPDTDSPARPGDDDTGEWRVRIFDH
ncbi:Nucleoid-associated protein YbaB [Mycobacterium talmoniae]|uniref:Nucleoid-associated protein YbaB n=1 Tax=Mycobacterium talmoniae TaxID=1858794 RepID=A0A1S1NPG8_9MYCO|nr:hypothetical protein BKN37_08865 [Mycobacterium talmoniae]PQM45296.1 Nucleoid-associated protein YbaB [Mycobacterium talmoniae]